jgi:hypothetical protein
VPLEHGTGGDIAFEAVKRLKKVNIAKWLFASNLAVCI